MMFPIHMHHFPPTPPSPQFEAEIVKKSVPYGAQLEYDSYYRGGMILMKGEILAKCWKDHIWSKMGRKERI